MAAQAEAACDVLERGGQAVNVLPLPAISEVKGTASVRSGICSWLKVTAIVKRGADPATEEEVLVNSDQIISIAGDANGSHIYVNGPSDPIRVKQKLQLFKKPRTPIILRSNG